MYKFLMTVIIFLLVSTLAAGCGRKQPSSESEMLMPMSISIEGEEVPATNLMTKEGTPVDVRTKTQSSAVEETAAGYAAPGAREIQQALKNAGLYTGSIDGKLGPMTKKAIVEFQQQNSLTADGKVGPKTWAKLKAYLNQQ